MQVSYWFQRQYSLTRECSQTKSQMTGIDATWLTVRRVRPEEHGALHYATWRQSVPSLGRPHGRSRAKPLPTPPLQRQQFGWPELQHVTGAARPAGPLVHRSLQRRRGAPRRSHQPDAHRWVGHSVSWRLQRPWALPVRKMRLPRWLRRYRLLHKYVLNSASLSLIISLNLNPNQS